MGQEKSSLNQMQTADGRNRTWMQMVPANRHDAPRARPLVVMLHGAGGSAGRVIGATRWDEVAEREGFVVACPNGTPSNESKRESFLRNPQTWNSGQGTSLAGIPLQICGVFGHDGYRLGSFCSRPGAGSEGPQG